MAKYFKCWVIVDGTQPTAFRAREAEDLLPTLKQLQRTQPDVALMWFERGRLWTSPADAQQALLDRRRTPPKGRGREWRPGGEHKDPRARPHVPRDEKRALFKKRLISKKTQGDGFPPSRSGRPPSGSQPDRRPPSGPPRDSTSGRRGPSRPPSGQASSPWKPSGPPSARRPPSAPSSSRRPPSGHSSFGRPPSSRSPSSRPTTGRPPSGRPGSGRPAGRPPRRRNDK